MVVGSFSNILKAKKCIWRISRTFYRHVQLFKYYSVPNKLKLAIPLKILHIMVITAALIVLFFTKHEIVGVLESHFRCYTLWWIYFIRSIIKKRKFYIAEIRKIWQYFCSIKLITNWTSLMLHYPLPFEIAFLTALIWALRIVYWRESYISTSMQNTYHCKLIAPLLYMARVQNQWNQLTQTLAKIQGHWNTI